MGQNVSVSSLFYLHFVSVVVMVMALHLCGDDDVSTVDRWTQMIWGGDNVWSERVLYVSSLFSQYFVCDNQWCVNRRNGHLPECARCQNSCEFILSLFCYHSVLCGGASVVWLFLVSGFCDFHVVFGFSHVDQSVIQQSVTVYPTNQIFVIH